MPQDRLKPSSPVYVHIRLYFNVACEVEFSTFAHVNLLILPAGFAFLFGHARNMLGSK